MKISEAIKLYTTLIIIAALIFIPAIKLFGPDSTIPSVKAQQSNTIYKQLGTDVASAPFTSANAPTIGQSYHLAYIRATNAPGHTCTSPAINGGIIEGSFDNTSFFPLTAGTLQVAAGSVAFNTSQQSLTAIGLAPYVRIIVNSFDTTNCRLQVYYSGSLYPAYVSKLENSRLEGGYAFVTVQSAAAQTLPVVPAGTSSTLPAPSVAIYGLQCSSDTTQVLQLAGGIRLFITGSIPVVWPPTGLPYMVLASGSSFSMTFPGTNPVDCFIQYRYEN